MRFVIGTTTCILASGDTDLTCTAASDISENLILADGLDVLKFLSHIHNCHWNYKADEAVTLHLGPTTQDFHAAFGLGESNVCICRMDVDSVALISIPALYALNLGKDGEA